MAKANYHEAVALIMAALNELEQLRSTVASAHTALDSLHLPPVRDQRTKYSLTDRLGTVGKWQIDMLRLLVWITESEDAAGIRAEAAKSRLGRLWLVKAKAVARELGACGS